MEQGEYSLVGIKSVERDMARATLIRAKIILGDVQHVDPSIVTDEEVAEAFRTGGFAEWDSELAGRVVRALATVGLEHI